MRAIARRVAAVCAAAVLAATMVVAGPGAGPAAADGAPGSTTQINLLNLNDFHGRIEGELAGGALVSSPTVQLAGTIEQLKAQHPGASVLLSAGDNVGASLFASGIQDDVPTIDVLNALGLAASAVGNHEFDQGWVDVERIRDLLDGPLLGANVVRAGDPDPLLPPYTVLDVAGVRVGVVGVVTQQSASLVNAGLLDGIEFADPIASANRYVSHLVEADLADVVVVEYHDGAPDGSQTLEQQLAASALFARIANETSPDADVIFTGHTHQAYVWDAPVPGETHTRPIVQAGFYGGAVAQVVLTVDDVDGGVIEYTARLVERVPDAGATAMVQLIADYPAVATVAEIVREALVVAEREGSVPVAELTAPVTRAFTAGEYVGGQYQLTPASAEDRAQASSLGTLVAESMLALLQPLPAPPDFAVMNPGGLRADLYPNGDGVVTVADARSVLPFNNELSIVVLTGEQVVRLLEQQWQRSAGGAAVDRPYLQLGLSSNVQYTYSEVPDPQVDGRMRGIVHGVWIDGVPIDPAAAYRVGTIAFLASGGDNLHVFREGDVIQTGLLDWQAWLDYLRAASPVSPDFERAGVRVDGLAGATVPAGLGLDVTVGGFDVMSVGAPRNTEVVAEIDGPGVVRAPLVDGVARMTLTAPEHPGVHAVTFTASPTGTAAPATMTVTARELATSGGDGAPKALTFSAVFALVLGVWMLRVGRMERVER